MADVKISELPVATAVSATDVGPIVHAGITVKATATQLTNAALQGISGTSGQVLTYTGSGTAPVWTDKDSGPSGYSGFSGISGYSGFSGISGYSGAIGTSGYSGYSGAIGTSGYSGYSGINTVPGYYGAFHYDEETQLNGAINSNSTADIVVDSTTGFSSTGAILIGTEVISYTGLTATSFTGITRGIAGTSGANHADNSPVSSAQVAAANTATAVQLNTTDLSNGVTFSNGSRINFANAGVYNVQFSIQFANATSNTIEDSAVWYKLNGNDIPASSSIVTLPTAHAGVPGAQILTVNLFVTVTAGQYVELYWSTNNGYGVITTYPSSAANPVRPATPAVIVTANQIA